MMHFGLSGVKTIQKIAWGWFLTCGLLGYFILHPMTMIAARFMSSSSPQGYRIWENVIARSITTAYAPAMLPWGFAFFLLSAIAGLLYARNQAAQAQKAKLQGVMELAGAACHELNQPMQVVLGYADLLARDISKNDPLRSQLALIIEQIDKMSLILKRIRNITSYETQDYIAGIKIIDLAKASQGMASIHQTISSDRR